MGGRDRIGLALSLRPVHLGFITWNWAGFILFLIRTNGSGSGMRNLAGVGVPKIVIHSYFRMVGVGCILIFQILQMSFFITILQEYGLSFN